MSRERNTEVDFGFVIQYRRYIWNLYINDFEEVGVMDFLGYSAAILNSIVSNTYYGMLRCSERGVEGGVYKQQKSRWPTYPRKGPLNISNFERL